MKSDTMDHVIDALLAGLAPLKFTAPVKFVYNPLIYARRSFYEYYGRYGTGRKDIILLGMNPGPWGMAQTGIPFGDVGMVKEWLGIDGKVDFPSKQHPKRLVQGFDCTRSEVSGRRLWGWARERYGDPKHFFQRFWVANYCPLVFMEESGRNRTPDKLKRSEQHDLFQVCDIALLHSIKLFKPDIVVGIGNFAFKRAVSALVDVDVKVGRITHPSPANPKANRGWAELIERELAGLGVLI